MTPVRKRRHVATSILVACSAAGMLAALAWGCKPRRSSSTSSGAGDNAPEDLVTRHTLLMGFLHGFQQGPGIHFSLDPIWDELSQAVQAKVEAESSSTNLKRQALLNRQAGLVIAARQLASDPDLHCLGGAKKLDLGKIIEAFYTPSETRCEKTQQKYKLCYDLESCDITENQLEELIKHRQGLDRKPVWGCSDPNVDNSTNRTIDELVAAFDSDVQCLPEGAARLDILRFQAASLKAQSEFHSMVAFELGKRPFPYLETEQGRARWEPKVTELKRRFDQLILDANTKLLGAGDPMTINASLRTGLIYDDFILPLLEAELPTEGFPLYDAFITACPNANCPPTFSALSLPQAHRQAAHTRLTALEGSAVRTHITNRAARLILERLGTNDITPVLRRVVDQARLWHNSWRDKWEAYVKATGTWVEKGQDDGAFPPQPPPMPTDPISPRLAFHVLSRWVELSEASELTLPFRADILKAMSNLMNLIPQSGETAWNVSPHREAAERYQRLYTLVYGPADNISGEADNANKTDAALLYVDPKLVQWAAAVQGEDAQKAAKVLLQHEKTIAKKLGNTFHSAFDELTKYRFGLLGYQLAQNSQTTFIKKLAGDHKIATMNNPNFMDQLTNAMTTEEAAQFRDVLDERARAEQTILKQSIGMACLGVSAVPNTIGRYFNTGLQKETPQSCWAGTFRFLDAVVEGVEYFGQVPDKQPGVYPYFKANDQGWTGRIDLHALCGDVNSTTDIRRRLDSEQERIDMTDECIKQTVQLQENMKREAYSAIAIPLIGGTGAPISLAGRWLFARMAQVAAVGRVMNNLRWMQGAAITAADIVQLSPSARVTRALVEVGIKGTARTLTHSLVQATIFEVGNRVVGSALGLSRFSDPERTVWSDWGGAIFASTLNFSLLAPTHWLGTKVGAIAKLGADRAFSGQTLQAAQFAAERVVPFATTTAYFATVSPAVHHMSEKFAQEVLKMKPPPQPPGGPVEDSAVTSWMSAFNITLMFEYVNKRFWNPVNRRIGGYMNGQPAVEIPAEFSPPSEVAQEAEAMRQALASASVAIPETFFGVFRRGGLGGITYDQLAGVANSEESAVRAFHGQGGLFHPLRLLGLNGERIFDARKLAYDPNNPQAPQQRAELDNAITFAHLRFKNRLQKFDAEGGARPEILTAAAKIADAFVTKINTPEGAVALERMYRHNDAFVLEAMWYYFKRQEHRKNARYIAPYP